MTSLSAALDWAPSFNDKPVPPAISVAIDAALPQSAIVEPEEARHVLIYSATAGYRHQSIPTGIQALGRMGVSTGAYDAIVSDDPANFEPKLLKTFDAVILLNTTGDFFMPHKKQRAKYSDADWAGLQERNDRLLDNLVDYVSAGGGLVGIHAPTDACYQHAAYGDMIGGYFDGHPWRANTEVTIAVEDPEHAVNASVFAGLDDFKITEEIYQFKAEPYSREKLRILLNLDVEKSTPVKGMKRADGDYAVAWVQSVGHGRVFYTGIGHNHHIYTNPLMLQHYLAGIQFATGDLDADTTPSAQK